MMKTQNEALQTKLSEHAADIDKVQQYKTAAHKVQQKYDALKASDQHLNAKYKSVTSKYDAKNSQYSNLVAENQQLSTKVNQFEANDSSRKHKTAVAVSKAQNLQQQNQNLQ